MTREELGSGIAHYRFDVDLGPGVYDIVRIHRVVHERRKYHPVPTKGDIFMIHGGSQDFDDTFLTAGVEDVNTKTSSPFYLASQNIDVWGIDLAWTMIPMETTDFSFMKNWGIDFKDKENVSKAATMTTMTTLICRDSSPTGAEKNQRLKESTSPAEFCNILSPFLSLSILVKNKTKKGR